MPNSVDIYLVRHGEALVPWSDGGDSGLSANGEQQATSVADRLSHLNNPLLISSPLVRALETGRQLSVANSAELQVDERFSEVPLPPDVPIRKKWLRTVSDMRWFDVDDSIKRWKSDAWAGLMALQEESVIFTHFMLINALVSRATSNENLICFEPDYGSITQLRITNGAKCNVASFGKEVLNLSRRQ